MEATRTQDFLLRSAKAQNLTKREMLDDRRDELSRYRRMGRYLTARYLGPIGLEMAGTMLGANQFIGNGGEQLVFANDKEVKKIVYSTLSSSKHDLQNKLKALIEQERSSRSFMSGNWLNTDYTVQKIWPGYHAVVAGQPKLGAHISFDTSDALAGMLSEYPGLRSETARLVANVRRLHINTGLYPDLLGPGNLVLTSIGDNLKLVIIDNILADADRQSKPTIENPEITRGEMIRQKLDLLYKAAYS